VCRCRVVDASWVWRLALAFACFVVGRVILGLALTNTSYFFVSWVSTLHEKDRSVTPMQLLFAFFFFPELTSPN
jgi:hypothetical protein